MNKIFIEQELLISTILEISSRMRIIAEIFPKENEHILKHFAAASIHLAFFMRDIHSIVMDKKINNEEYSEMENKFLDECGCNFRELNRK